MRSATGRHVSRSDPHESAATPGVHGFLRLVVVHQRDGVRQVVARLTLRPVDDLEDVSTRHVVRSGRTCRGRLPAAVQVDPEARRVLLPVAVTLIHAHDVHVGHADDSHTGHGSVGRVCTGHDWSSVAPALGWSEVVT